MDERFVFLTGSVIVATALALLTTYNDYRDTAEMIMVILGTTGGILSIIQFVSKTSDTVHFRRLRDQSSEPARSHPL